MNECNNTTLNNCDLNAECLNLVGSFQCQCKTGYSGNGTICEGILNKILFKVFNILVSKLYENLMCNQSQISKYKSVRIRSFSGPDFPAFGLNTEIYRVNLRIVSKCGEIRTVKTQNAEAFHAVEITRFTEQNNLNFFLHWFIFRSSFRRSFPLSSFTC